MRLARGAVLTALGNGEGSIAIHLVHKALEEL